MMNDNFDRRFALLQAVKDGADIDYRAVDTEKWIHATNKEARSFVWNFVDFEYRTQVSTSEAINDLKKDALSWGDALNEASWTFIDQLTLSMGEPCSSLVFNHTKTALREAIIKYLQVVKV